MVNEALDYYSLALELDPYLFDARERIAALRTATKTVPPPQLPDGGDAGLRLLGQLERAAALLSRYRCDEVGCSCGCGNLRDHRLC